MRGWRQTQVKNRKEYTSIKWDTLNGYCNDLGFPNLLGKDDYIPDSEIVEDDNEINK